MRKHFCRRRRNFPTPMRKREKRGLSLEKKGGMSAPLHRKKAPPPGKRFVVGKEGPVPVEYVRERRKR